MAYSPKQKQKIFDDICESIVNGMSLRKALLNCNNLPAITFFKWLNSDELKAKQYARATEIRGMMMFEDMLDIANTPTEGIVTKQTNKGIEITTGDMLGHRTLQVDTMKWSLSKMIPKKYGNIPDIKDTETDNEITIKVIDGTK